MGVMARRKARSYSYSVFYEQAPEGGYVASVPALPGCHTQGETIEEAEQNMKDAIALYLESLAAHRIPPPPISPPVLSRQPRGGNRLSGA
jgi:predicted RNase H-like HicB family nuclease